MVSPVLHCKMPGKTNNLRDKLEENQLDLSLMQLTEVPVKEISELPKGTHLDLSNNLLTWLPENFPTLTHLIHLDLSKNQLTELPEYFGQLKNLRHLDLYSNQLNKLPVSVSQLKNLKWLDLKNNPLNDSLATAAGNCITPADCAVCAKRVVSLMQSIQSHQERERQKQLLLERKLEEQRKLAEEAERERIRAEKKAAKEKRRQEAREREETARKEAELAALNSIRHEMEQNPNEAQHHSHHGDAKAKGSCLWSVWLFLVASMFLAMGFGFSLVWIYTGGHLDQRSIERALPIIQRDADLKFAELSKRTHLWVEQARPYTEKAMENAKWLWEDFKARNDIVAHKINTHLGPYFCAAKKALYHYWIIAQNEVGKAWIWAKPFLIEMVDMLVHYAKVSLNWMETNLPIYADVLYHKIMEAAEYVQTSFNSMRT